MRALAERELGTQALEQAVVSLRDALATVSQQSHRENWALFQGALGVTLGRLAERRGSSADTAAGVEACRAAVSVLRLEQEAYRWANAQQELGDALTLLGNCSGDRGVLGEALACFERAEGVLTQAAFPRYWRSIEDRAEKLRSHGLMPSGSLPPGPEVG